MALNWATFKNPIIFSLIKWQGWLINCRHMQARYFEKNVFFRFCSCRNEKKMIFSILVSSIKYSYLSWLAYTQRQNNIFNLEKNYVFPSFPFSKKSGLFFARLVTRNFTRALGTPSARFRMGRATRAAVNARRSQRGTQSTRDAVNAGRS